MRDRFSFTWDERTPKQRQFGRTERFLTESKKGIAVMCKAMEDMRMESLQEGRKESMKEVALRMLADGALSLEKIAEYSGLSLEEVKKLNENKSA